MRKSRAYSACDANTNDSDAGIFDALDHTRQLINLACWISIGDQNNEIWHIRTVAMGNGEYVAQRKSKCGCRVRVATTVWQLTNFYDEGIAVREVA